jgi:N-sulfoglucosamine sulfohydrolase
LRLAFIFSIFRQENNNVQPLSLYVLHMKNSSVIFLLTLYVLQSSLIVSARQVSKSRPNIVLIVSDDHGREAVGCYGNKVIRTPNIDALAKEGVLFTNAFATVPSCSPSRSVLLSGRYSHSNGMYGLEHREHHFSAYDTVQSLPVLLEKAGYRTARIGKYHVGPESVFHFQKVLQGAIVDDPNSIGRSPVVMADLCKAFIAGPSTQPFFLYYATDDPHRSSTFLPNGAPDFGGKVPNQFGNRKEGYPQVNEITYRPEEVPVPAYLTDTKGTREELAQYYQSISRLDQGIGRLVQHLKQAGKWDNTVIIYLSDNGAPFPGSKTNVYEPGIRLPCILKLPHSTVKNFRQDAMISWVDIMPTLLGFAGVAKDAFYTEGRSFAAISGEQQAAGWDEVYASHSFHEITMYYPMRVLRERKYKLIYNIASDITFPSSMDLYNSYTWQWLLAHHIDSLGKRPIAGYLHRPKFELYDLEKDPDEVDNLASRPAYAKELERMKAKIKAFQRRTNDPWVSKWDVE